MRPTTYSVRLTAVERYSDNTRLRRSGHRRSGVVMPAKSRTTMPISR